jgi:hypothetical protein
MILSCCLASSAQAQQGKKCFFESDCVKGFSCVTPKGAMNGSCQPRNSVLAKEEETTTGSTMKSIIGEEGRCTFNTDCPDGGQCIKEPGTLYGTCQGSGYGTALPLNANLLDQKRTCFFDQDCKPGQRCAKPQGSFKGMCEDDFFDTNTDSKDPREMLRNQFRTSNRQCLQDGDCGIREACLQKERSVFGVCTAKSVINAQTNTLLPSATSTSDPFKF